MISLIFHFLKLWVFCNVARLHVVCQPWWPHIQKWGCVLEKCLWLQICHLFQGTNCFYLVDKLCPALRNHCLLGHSPRLFLQPAGDNPLNPRQSEDHIHCLDEKKTLNCWSCLWPQLNPTNSPHFQSVCFSENPAIPLQYNLHGSFGIGFVHYTSCSGIRSMPHRQVMKGSLICWDYFLGGPQLGAAAAVMDMLAAHWEQCLLNVAVKLQWLWSKKLDCHVW